MVRWALLCNQTDMQCIVCNTYYFDGFRSHHVSGFVPSTFYDIVFFVFFYLFPCYTIPIRFFLLQHLHPKRHIIHSIFSFVLLPFSLPPPLPNSFNMIAFTFEATNSNNDKKRREKLERICHTSIDWREASWKNANVWGAVAKSDGVWYARHSSR